MKMRIRTILTLSWVQNICVSGFSTETGIGKITKENSLITDKLQEDKECISRSTGESSFKSVTDIDATKLEKAFVLPSPASSMLKASPVQEVGSEKVEGSLHTEEKGQSLSGYAPEFYDPKTRTRRKKGKKLGKAGKMASHGESHHINSHDQGDFQASEDLLFLRPIDRQKWLVGHMVLESPFPSLSYAIEHGLTQPRNPNFR